MFSKIFGTRKVRTVSQSPKAHLALEPLADRLNPSPLVGLQLYQGTFTVNAGDGAPADDVSHSITFATTCEGGLNVLDGANVLGGLTAEQLATVHTFRVFGGSKADTLDLRGLTAVNGGVFGVQVVAGAGNDTVYGSNHTGKVNPAARWNESIYGEAGNDVITAGAGDDFASGEAGNDTVRGGAGEDDVFGGAGSDALYGDAGNDYVAGGDGADNVNGGDGNDEVRGDAGNDYVIGGSGDDVMQGGAGSDLIESRESGATSTGNDTIYGGEDAGNGDVDVVIRYDAATDSINGIEKFAKYVDGVLVYGTMQGGVIVWES